MVRMRSWSRSASELATVRAFSRPVERAAPSTAASTPRARMAKMTAATMASIRPKPASSPGRGTRGGWATAATGPVWTRVIAVFIDRAGRGFSSG